MTVANPPNQLAADAAPMPTAQVLSIWARHLLSFYFPLNATLYLMTGPHAWWGSLLFLVPILVAFQLDTRPGWIERRQPREALPAWPFDLLVYALAGVQLLNIVLLTRMFSNQSFWSFDLFVGAFVVVGASSGFSIITAHELIHRTRPFERWLGRALLVTVLYEHFFTEHLRGHHVRVGTDGDPATARFGDPFWRFLRRTVPAQFRSAWRLESKRLGDADMSLLDPRMRSHRVVHGLLAGVGLLAVIGATGGVVAATAFVFQALMAIRLLETVNYFEHWGLERSGRRVAPSDSWDTHSWFTYYSLVGLSRHADHHAHASRPYQQLRVFEEPPLLPSGYVGTIGMVMFDNAGYRAYCRMELERLGLGPFRPSRPSEGSDTRGEVDA